MATSLTHTASAGCVHNGDSRLMYIQFIAVNPESIAAIKKVLFENYSDTIGTMPKNNFFIKEGPLTEKDLYATHAVVTPGNSFGHMTGGFDKALVDLLGFDLDDHVRDEIVNKEFGELNVGQAMMINPTGYKRDFEFNNGGSCPYIVYAPTMRVPGRISPGSSIPYMAMLAAMKVIATHNAVHRKSKESIIDTVLIALPGAATGEVPSETSIRQCLLAIEQVTNQTKYEHLNKDASEHNATILNTWT